MKNLFGCNFFGIISTIIISQSFAVADELPPLIYDEEFILTGCSKYDDGSDEQKTFIETCVSMQEKNYKLYQNIRNESVFGYDIIDRFAYLCSQRAPEDNYWFNVRACTESSYFTHVIASVHGPLNIIINCQIEVGPFEEFEGMRACVEQKLGEVR